MALSVQQATAVLALRRLIGTVAYTDEELSAILTAAGSEYAAAARVWLEKTTATATLVDISEGSSRRTLSGVHRQAAERAIYFQALAAGEVATADTRPRTRAIVRP